MQDGAVFGYRHTVLAHHQLGNTIALAEKQHLKVSLRDAKESFSREEQIIQCSPEEVFECVQFSTSLLLSAPYFQSRL